MDDNTTNINDQLEIVLEMKFPPNYPQQPPEFRIVKPRFENIDIDLEGLYNSSNSNNNNNNDSANDINSPTSNNNTSGERENKRRHLSMSTAIDTLNSKINNNNNNINGNNNSNNNNNNDNNGDANMATENVSISPANKKGWNPTSASIMELVQQIRSFIIDSNAKIDMEAGTEVTTMIDIKSQLDTS